MRGGGGESHYWEPPGALLEASWGLLGRSWRLPGASWAPLGPSWAVLEAIQNKTKMKSIFEPPKIPKKILDGSFFGSILDAKIDQNGIQNESKFKTIFKSEKNALQEPLGAILARSWGRSELQNHAPTAAALVFSKI